jgi:hypothetical protein
MEQGIGHTGTAPSAAQVQGSAGCVDRSGGRG